MAAKGRSTFGCGGYADGPAEDRAHTISAAVHPAGLASVELSDGKGVRPC